jgi:nucleoside-diphosphate-sugar epimerase
MRIFLTGATGYIGHAVLDGLVRGGHAVTGFVRNSEKAALVAAAGAQPLIGDLGRPESYRQAAEEHDGIILAGFESGPRGVEIDRLAIETLAGAARAIAARGDRAFLIYTSGIWVLGEPGEPATESTMLDPAPHVTWRPGHEQAILQAGGDGLRTVIVRPGIVYGGSGGIVGELFRDAINGIVRVVGSGENRWPLVYARDLADLYARLCVRPDAAGVYHANDEGDERVNDIVEAIVTHVPNEPSVRHVPLEEAKAKMGLYAVALAQDLVLRSARARALGWTPTLHSVAGNIARLLEEWRAQEV